MNWFDLASVVIILFFVFLGMRKGLLKSLAHLLGLVLGFVVSLSFYQKLSDYINAHWQIKESIENYLAQLPFNDEILNISSPAFDNLQSMSLIYHNWLQLLTSSDLAISLQDIYQIISQSIVNVIAFASLFMFTVILVNVLFKIFSVLLSVGSLGMFGGVNRFGGAIFGFLRGSLVVSFLVIGISYACCFLVFSDGGFWSSFFDAFYDSQVSWYIWGVLDILDISLLDGFSL